MRELRTFLWQSLVVILLCEFRVERQIELILPPKLEPRLRKRIVPLLSTRVTLGQIGCVSRNLVSYHAVFHILLVGQTKMFFWSDVTQHRGSEPSDHCRADRRSYVIVAGRDIGHQRTQRIKRSFAADFQLSID